uniref:Putative ovule protein n=1 Tax=Solanum chacoense TaxID=4108 RepID=A0A0V0HBI1_SOLCH
MIHQTFRFQGALWKRSLIITPTVPFHPYTTEYTAGTIYKIFLMDLSTSLKFQLSNAFSRVSGVG